LGLSTFLYDLTATESTGPVAIAGGGEEILFEACLDWLELVLLVEFELDKFELDKFDLGGGVEGRSFFLK